MRGRYSIITTMIAGLFAANVALAKAPGLDYKIMWHYKASGAVTGLSHKDENIGVTTDDHVIFLSTDGKERYKHKTENLIGSGFTDYDGDGDDDYLFAEKAGRITIINSNTKKDAWHNDHTEHFFGPYNEPGTLFYHQIHGMPVVSGDGVYVTSHLTGRGYGSKDSTGFVTKFDIRTGKKIWQIGMPNSPFYVSPIVFKGHVYVAMPYKGLVAKLRADDGEVIASSTLAPFNVKGFDAKKEIAPIMFDFDNDGKKDLVVAGSSLRVYNNLDFRKILSFNLASDALNAPALGSKLKVIDIDNDGLEEIVFSDEAGNMYIAENKKVRKVRGLGRNPELIKYGNSHFIMTERGKIMTMTGIEVITSDSCLESLMYHLDQDKFVSVEENVVRGMLTDNEEEVKRLFGPGINLTPITIDGKSIVYADNSGNIFMLRND